MRRSLRPRLVAAAVAALLMLGTTSCGGSNSSGDAPKADASSSSAGEESSPAGDSGSESAEPTDEASTGGSAQGDTLTLAEFKDMVGDGSTFTTVHMTMSGKAEGKNLTGDIDMDISDLQHPLMKMSMKTGGEAFEMIVVEGAMYLGQPGSSEPYLKMPYDDSAVPFSLKKDESNLVDGIIGDSKLTKIVYVGDEDVDGVSARHFTMFAKGEKPLQLWLDGDARPVLITMTVDGSPLRMAFSDFDEPVDIKAPENVQEMPQ